MIAPIGFDLAPFLPHQGTPVTDMMKTTLALGVERQALAQKAFDAALHQKLAREQEAFNRDHMLKVAQTAEMQEAQTNARKQWELEQAANIDAMNRDRAQSDLESGFVGDATKAFGLGDTATLDAVQAKAARAAPLLSFGHELSPGLGMDQIGPDGIFGADAAFQQGKPGLNIARDGETLYSGDTATARKRQQEVFRAGTSDLIGSEGGTFDPYIASGFNSAGLGGVSGVAATERALKYGDEAAKRRQHGIDSQALSVSRNDTMARSNASAEQDYLNNLHQKVEATANQFVTSQKLIDINKSRTAMSGILSQLNSPDPWSQNKANMDLMSASIKGAMSDKDVTRAEGAAGFLNKFDKDLSYFLSGGELPENFKEQVQRGLELVEKHNNYEIERVGLAAMDHIYTAPALMRQFRTPQEAAQFALQAYHKVTGNPVTPQDVDHEVETILQNGVWAMKMQSATSAPHTMTGGQSGGGGGSVRLGGQLADPAVLDSLGGLGSGLPVPKLPVHGQPTGDAEALELLRGLHGGP